MLIRMRILVCMNAMLRILALAATLAVLVLALALPSPLQARVLNIVAIGASNTTGFGVGEQNAYPAVLQTLLGKKGIAANVTNAGVNGDVTAGMLRRIDSAVPKGTDIVILQPGGNDLRFFGTRAARTANIAAMAARVRARGIRVIIYDPDPVPADFYQWDHIHFNAAAHAKIAAVLAAQIEAAVKPQAPPQAAVPQPAPAKP
jgi:acyl-CoA thioesterase-1